MSLKMSMHGVATALAGAAIASGLVSGLGGCATQSELDGFANTTRALDERNITLQQELEARDGMVDMLRTRVSDAEATVREARDRNAKLNADLLTLREDYRQLNERLSNVGFTPLDPLTDQALREFAARNPNAVRYDADRGMLQLASDLTFALGSAEVSSSAAQTLATLATLLNDPQASKYDIRIIGHTDNVPIGASRARHKTNMHLSAHRAIGVHAALKAQGVSPERMEIAGRGEFQPVVANPTRGGAAQNRRVEIFLIPRTNGAPYAPYSPAVTEADSRRPPMPMK